MEKRQLNSVEELVEGLGKGEATDTDQAFTLSFENLGGRYRTFQAQSESYYLLRLIQGLVRAGALGIEIKTTRNTIALFVPLFRIDGPDWLLPSVLAERLAQPNRWCTALQSVCVAIHCTCTPQFEGLEWCYKGELLSGTSSVENDYRVGSRGPSRMDLRF